MPISSGPLMDANLTITVDNHEPQVKTIALEHFKDFTSSSSIALVLFHKRWLGLFKAILPASLFTPPTIVVVLPLRRHSMFIQISCFVSSICFLCGVI